MYLDSRALLFVIIFSVGHDLRDRGQQFCFYLYLASMMMMSPLTHRPTFQNSPVARKRFNIECLETAWELVNVQFKINRSIWGYLEASSWQFWSRSCVSSISSCLFVSNEAVILSKQMCYASKCQNNLRTAFQNTLTQHN